MTMKWSGIMLALAIAMFTGCEGGVAPGSNGTDADTDSDSDTDSDGDGDSDSSTDDDDGGFGLEDWDMYLTVDNQFAVYFGTPEATTGVSVGGGADWPTEFHFTAEDRQHTDYLYVATASDQFVAQGFIGTFTNLTLSKTTNTGDDVWEVFPAGAYAETNTYWPNPWPASVMPTQTEVDTAIAYAEANDLWVTPVGAAGYDNDPSTSISPYTSEPWATAAYVNIPIDADWIWHQSETVFSGDMPSPLEGYNHDEFLVFRVAGAVGIE
jgi:hypothetical protein